MTAEEFDIKYEELFQAAYWLRHYQLMWKQYQISSDKNKMLYYQHKVDTILGKEVKRRKSKQQEIF